MANRVDLLRELSVRRELEINDGQLRELGEIRREMERELIEFRRRLAIKYKAKVESVLLPHQSRRLNQLILHRRGITALLDDDLARRLKLSAVHREEIAKRLDQGRMRIEKLRLLKTEDGKPVDPRHRLERLEIISMETEAKILDVLTKNQRAAYQKLKGPIPR